MKKLTSFAVVSQDPEQQQQHVILGPGLRREGEKVMVTRPGVLRTKAPAVFWVGKLPNSVGGTVLRRWSS